jgi:uncharacterized protein YjgD (DUF1641 family)
MPSPSTAPAPDFLAARPSQIELLGRIDARLERLEARLARLDPLLDAAPGLLALTGDTVDELAAELGDADDRVRSLVALAERVSRPETLARLHAAIDVLDQIPGLLAIAGDTFDELAQAAAERGIPLDQIVPELGRAMNSMLRLATSGALTRLLDSDLLMPGAIAALETAARAMATATQAPESRVGLLAMFKAMREPEIQRALGFALDVARRFGTHVDQLQLPEGEQ